MANLYLYEITAYESVSQVAIGLQPFHPKDVSTVPGCIHRVMRSTSFANYLIMRSLFTLFLVLLFASTANAKEYGTFDYKRLVTVTETSAGKKFDFDIGYLDQILNDLSAHAKNYPPQFDSPQDQQRAIRDVVTVSGMLDFLINVPNPNPELLGRAAYLSSLGHNLNITGAAERANSLFQRLLAIAPSDPRGNHMYGTFLAGVGKPKEALPYLEKALCWCNRRCFCNWHVALNYRGQRASIKKPRRLQASKTKR